MRAPTLAAHAECLYTFADHIITALRTGDLEHIEEVLEEVRAFQPPHGINPVTALVVVLAAQINPTVPVEQRIAWVEAFDPAATTTRQEWCAA